MFFKGKRSIKPSMKSHYNFLVVGSGLAGLAFALRAREIGSTAILSKTTLETGNTERAQGGIAAVMSKEDSMQKHIRDTLTAGAGLCDEDTVRFVVEQGPDRIRDLVDWGVHFDLDQKADFALTREGGHSDRRILHVEDHTGLEIQRQLLGQVRTGHQVDLFEQKLVIELITNRQLNPRDFSPMKVVGAHVLDKSTGETEVVLADFIILATGGAGKTYLYTSNWSGASGDGIAMAYRAGARVANLEFMQFHPTCLYHSNTRNFLISEALRGEGGELVNAQGFAFMRDQHPLGSLAPRDIVARSIDAEMRRSGAECVYLDMTHKPKDFLQHRFPHIFARCADLGIDIATQPIPVVPAAHYLCGGVLTDLNGRTDMANLYAIGETACTGLHGANRLASNSLLECLVFANSAFLDIREKMKDFRHEKVDPPGWPRKNPGPQDELDLASYMWDEIRRLMWAYVGIVRTDRRLARAQNRMRNLLSEFKEFYSDYNAHPDIIELRNLATVADLTGQCALCRKESRGIHFNLDYPTSVAAARDTILDPGRT